MNTPLVLIPAWYWHVIGPAPLVPSRSDFNRREEHMLLKEAIEAIDNCEVAIADENGNDLTLIFNEDRNVVSIQIVGRDCALVIVE